MTFANDSIIRWHWIFNFPREEFQERGASVNFISPKTLSKGEAFN